jgi:hypothetical protein
MISCLGWSGGVHCAQEINDLVADQIRRFVLYPMAYIFELEPANKTRQARAHLVYCKRIEFFQSIRLSPDKKRGLGDLRSFESCGQMEIGFGGAVIVEATVKAGALEFRDVMVDVFRLRPWRQRTGGWPMKAPCRIQGTPLLARRSRARGPMQDAWNRDCGVSPNLTGVPLICSNM